MKKLADLKKSLCCNSTFYTLICTYIKACGGKVEVDTKYVRSSSDIDDLKWYLLDYAGGAVEVFLGLNYTYVIMNNIELTDDLDKLLDRTAGAMDPILDEAFYNALKNDKIDSVETFISLYMDNFQGDRFIIRYDSGMCEPEILICQIVPIPQPETTTK